MHGGPAVDCTKLLGSFIGHPGTYAVAEKTKRHSHQGLEYMIKSIDERAH